MPVLSCSVSELRAFFAYLSIYWTFGLRDNLDGPCRATDSATVRIISTAWCITGGTTPRHLCIALCTCRPPGVGFV